MESRNYKWLPHLENSIPDSAYGYTASLYTIALEGWRRGLDLKFIKTNRSKSNTVFELSDGKVTHQFVSSRGDLVTSKALRICRNKSLTKEYLLKSNIPTPKGRDFSKDIPNSEIIDYAKKQGYPLVVKPLDGTGGKGVIANIENEAELKDALSYVREELGYLHVIVEEYFEGEDYRIYVIENEVVAATKRIRANVIGDGKTNIKKLIQKKNQEKKDSKLYRSSLIKIDKELKDELSKRKYTLDSIPSMGEKVYLKSKNNISSGGDPVDILDELSDEMKQIAIDGLNAIPGLPHGGIDLLVNKDKNTGVIIEINSQASIRLNLFPLVGTARDIPAKLIDFYFPNTTSNPDVPLFFEFDDVWQEFRKGNKTEYIIPSIKPDDLEITRFIVKGRVRRVGYGKWVKDNAQKLNIHGYVNHLKNGTTSIVAAGYKDDLDKFRHIIVKESSSHFKISKIVEKSRKSPVLVGFKLNNVEVDNVIKDGYHPVRLKDPTRHSNSRKKSTSDKAKSNKIDYKDEYHKIINSTSWKMTKPLRYIRKLIKNKV